MAKIWRSKLLKTNHCSRAIGQNRIDKEGREIVKMRAGMGLGGAGERRRQRRESGGKRRAGGRECERRADFKLQFLLKHSRSHTKIRINVGGKCKKIFFTFQFFR